METISTETEYKIARGNFNFWMLAIITIFIVFYVISMMNKEEKKVSKEHMTAGTLTQMFANDGQDTYLKNDINNEATGNFNLYWNQPTRVAGTYPNRGQLLPSVVLPMVAAIENGNNPETTGIELTTNEAERKAYNELVGRVYKDKMRKLKKYIDDPKSNDYLQTNCGENCYVNPAACGNGHGGYRLGSNFVEPTTSKPFVSLQGNVYYPDEYVGQFWLQPKPDIMKPLPVIANGLPPLSYSQP
jgi:hypothetical protein